jgi:hypothetical protein
MAAARHVGPVILETVLANLAETALGGLQKGFRNLECQTLLLLTLRPHLATELLLLGRKVGRGTVLNRTSFTLSEGRRKAGVKWSWSWL